MKIFSAKQVREWDAFTIANEPITSIDLMERAATACFKWITEHFISPETYVIFCGTGNNGADGLAIVRMLLQADKTVVVYILEGEKRSDDFSVNLERLKLLMPELTFIDIIALPKISPKAIIIDALFGTGLSRPLKGGTTDLVNHLNNTGNAIISVDMPSGLYADSSSNGNCVIKAKYTLSFQVNKLAFLLAENSQLTGMKHILDIGLHPDFYHQTPTLFNSIEHADVKLIYKPRNQFSHKYNFGHALLYAGSKNMMGAAVLCAKACLRAGAGLVTVFTEDGTQPVIQVATPEAISSTETDFEKLSLKKSAIGIGPGLALTKNNKTLLRKIVDGFSGPIVMDASALQMLSLDIELLSHSNLTPAILTPHTGEFEKLFGRTSNDLERMNLALQKATAINCYIVLKGHHTLIACPDGSAFFNTTGNAGMATAGSGDVLTGVLSGLLAQGYSQKDACILGVFLHGKAGDIAATKWGQEAMIAGDIIDALGEAYKSI